VAIRISFDFLLVWTNVVAGGALGAFAADNCFTEQVANGPTRPDMLIRFGSERMYGWQRSSRQRSSAEGGRLGEAHELAERGFAVMVCERNAAFGGNARSVP
jgi:hypothetical protein